MKVHLVVALFASSACALAQPDPTQDLLNNRHFQQEQSFKRERSFPSGIPQGARLKAIEQITIAASVTPPPSGTWVNIGPAPISVRQNNTFAGRVTAIAVDPTNKSHWYIGAAQGGVWETLDGGASWAPRTDNQPSLAMGALAIAPSSPNIIYAGTGEANFSGDSYSGVGVLKSTDGGATWQLLAGNGGFTGSSFSSIRVSPTDPTVVEAATVGSGTTGILKSTDGGITWTSKKIGFATALEVAPDNFNNQYSGFINSFTFDEVARSTDGGETWADVCGPWCDLPGSLYLGRTAIAIAPSDPRTVYVTIVNANANSIVDIWKTSNAWDAVPAWITLPHTNFCGAQCWYDLVLSIDPSNPNVLYAGGIGIWRFDGATWSDITGTSHVDQHAYVFVGNQLIVGNDGGVWTTKAGGIKNGNWKDRNGNLAITQFYKGSASPDGQFVLGGSQDNGTEAWSGPVNGPVPWSFVFGGDGAASAISATSPSLDWAVSFQGQIILRTVDGGRTFSRADTTLDHTGASFIGNFKKCSNDDNTFLAGTATLQKCSDFFSAVTPSWTIAFPNVINATFGLMDFAASDSTCGTYACGCFSFGRPQVFITTDDGLSFNNLDPFQMLPSKVPTCLVFDPGHANVMYITFSGFGSGHVFQTVNATQAQGTFWTDISPPVDIPFNTVAVNSVDGAVYVGTDIGVWKSPDGGKTWSHYGPELGFPNVAVFDLEISKSGQVFAFTHGRGAFALLP